MMAVSFVAGTAQAGEWRVANVDEKTLMLVDTSTVRKAPYSQKKVAWAAWLFSHQAEDGADYFKIQIEADCSVMDIAYLALYRYGVDGSVIGSEVGAGPPNPVIPDTKGQDLFRVICDGSDSVAFDTVQDALEIYRDIIANPEN